MKRAFTLIEILVSVAIVGILMGILLPAFVASRNRAKGATCLSNLSQIGKAVMMYAADNEDAVPYALSSQHAQMVAAGQEVFTTEKLNAAASSAPDVRTVLKPYGATAQTWFCPMDHISSLLKEDGVNADTFYEACGSSYGYDDERALLSWPLTRYQKQSESLIAWDLESFHGGEGPSGIIHVLFADGHAKAITNQQRSQYMYQSYLSGE